MEKYHIGPCFKAGSSISAGELEKDERSYFAIAISGICDKEIRRVAVGG
ncbi:hypothetical protein [Desulfoluna limicola]|nr:hypothetical protein [Desulfoluna limicola]